MVTHVKGGGTQVKGYFADGRSTLINCTAAANTGTATTVVGIHAAAQSIVEKCMAHGQTHHGILVENGSIVRDSMAANNGVSGIRATGASVRVENNHAFQNGGVGIHSFGNNILLRNTAKANVSNFVVQASDTYGPIVAGPGPLTNALAANPWANITF